MGYALDSETTNTSGIAVKAAERKNVVENGIVSVPGSFHRYFYLLHRK